MSALLRLLQLLSIAIWVGGLVFFAFVLAPVAFHVLPALHDAGLIVGSSLKLFNRIALVCGAVFLGATGILFMQGSGRLREICRLELLFVSIMLLGTAYLHWNIISGMDRDQRLAGGDINTLAPFAPPRVHFDRLHHHSVKVAGGVLLLGLGAIFLLSRELTLITKPDKIPGRL